MKRPLVAIVLSSVISSACAEPECGSNEHKIGATCYLNADARVRDSAAAADVGERTGSKRDAGRLDAGRDIESDDPAENVGDAATAQGPSSSLVARCGDGRLNGTEVCDYAVASGQTGECANATSCTNANKCLVAKLTGDAQTCTASCETSPLTSCTGGDGCCPTGCSTASDSDCSASCGNGHVDTAAGETCEANVAPGCPGSCDDKQGCTADALTGSASNCNAACTHTPITGPKLTEKDGCCPPGANANNDLDCAVLCGNNVVEAGELCDGNCPSACDDHNACTADSVQGTGCSRSCVSRQITNIAADGCCVAGENHNTEAACPVACGNSVVEAPEQCDDGNTTGSDGCSSACKFDDNVATFGDDRPGYIRCGDSMTCPPKSSCRGSSMLVPGTSTFVSAFQCEPTWSGSSTNCDGPEDCDTGHVCGLAGDDSGQVGCLLPDMIFMRFCHQASDCSSTGFSCRDGLWFAHVGECK